MFNRLYTHAYNTVRPHLFRSLSALAMAGVAAGAAYGAVEHSANAAYEGGVVASANAEINQLIDSGAAATNFTQAHGILTQMKHQQGVAETAHRNADANNGMNLKLEAGAAIASLGSLAFALAAVSNDIGTRKRRRG